MRDRFRLLTAVFAVVAVAGCSGSATSAPASAEAPSQAPASVAASVAPSAAPSAEASAAASAAASGAADACAAVPTDWAADATRAPSFAFPTGPVKLTMFGSDEQQTYDLENKLIKEYQQLHPNVTVDNQLSPLGPAFDKLSVQLPAGGGPTLFSVYEPWTEGFFKGGYLAPAPPEVFAVTDQAGIMCRYIPNALAGQSRNGTVYELPLSQNAFGWLTNIKEFTAAGLKIPDDVPTTWDQVADLQPKLLKKDASGKIIQKGFEFRYTADAHWIAQIFAPMVEQLGGTVVDDQGNPTITTPQAIAAAEVFKKLAVAPTISKNTQPAPYTDFGDGQDVMTFAGRNAISFVGSTNPEMNGNIAFSDLPVMTGGKPGSQKYSFNYAVNNNASKDEQMVAWDLIRFMLDHPQQHLLEVGSMSSLRDWQNDPSVATQPFLKEALQVIANAYPFPRAAHWPTLQTALGNAMQRIVLNGQDVTASLNQAVTEYNQAVGQ